uniref:TauD/TfdA family dioxygenase n=1 Tax=Cupriavidus yeoncheonensis TaxID=1462994 RepID=UPI003F490E59
MLLTTLVAVVAGCSGSSNGGVTTSAPPAGLTEHDATVVYAVGNEIVPDTLTSGGGSITQCSVSPALPAGLTMDPATGRISGELIAPLRARHSIECTFGAAMPIEKRHALRAQYSDAGHPVMRTHPETGKKVLFVYGFTAHFTNFHTAANVRVGQDFAPDSAQLLQYLISQAAIPEYQVRWRWKHNDVAIWDNRSTQHYAVMD